MLTRRTSGFLVLLALAAAAGLGSSAAQDLPEGVDWLTDLDAARETAREEGRPLLIVFR